MKTSLSPRLTRRSMRTRSSSNFTQGPHARQFIMDARAKPGHDSEFEAPFRIVSRNDIVPSANGGSIERTPRRPDRHRLKLPRRHRRGGDALSGRQCRCDHARHSALGYRLYGVAAGGTVVARQMAERKDWPAVAGLGLCFFGLFFVLYNIAVGYTTAARASLALSTLPLQTMVVGALLGIEPLTARKTLGVGIAFTRRAGRARLGHRGRAAGAPGAAS